MQSEDDLRGFLNYSGFEETSLNAIENHIDNGIPVLGTYYIGYIDQNGIPHDTDSPASVLNEMGYHLLGHVVVIDGYNENNGYTIVSPDKEGHITINKDRIDLVFIRR